MATVGEESFKYGTAVLMHTVCASLNKDAQVQFHIVDINLTDRTREALRATAVKSESVVGVNFLTPADSALFRTLEQILKNNKRSAHFREICWLAKFTIPDLLQDVAECLYLDSDMYCNRDVYSLSTLDRKNLPMMAVWDTTTVMEGKAWEYELLGLDKKAPYFNGGFLYFDLTAWRREKLGEKAIESLRLAPDRLIDQSLFNLIFYNRWHILDNDWNVQSHFHYGALADISRGRKFILHYASNPKPWQIPVEEKTREFYLALDQTAYSGWRPNPIYWALHFKLRKAKMHLSRWLTRQRT